MRASAAMAPRSEPPSQSRISSRSPPTCALSSSDVPSAITSPWSITAMRSARRSASSRYWVVSSTVVPRDEPLDRSQSADAAADVETGRRLVEEEHGRPRDERGREVEPSPHSAGVRLARAGRRPPTGRTRSSSSRRARRGRPRAEVVEPPDHLEVLEAGQVLVDRRVLARKADVSRTRGASRTTSMPATRAVPCRAGAAWSGSAPPSSCRPRSARASRTPCRSRLEVDAAKRDDVAVPLVEPLGLDGRAGRNHVLHATVPMPR